jgi:hypothetical protein
MLAESGLTTALTEIPANLKQQPKNYQPLKQRKSK